MGGVNKGANRTVEAMDGRKLWDDFILILKGDKPIEVKDVRGPLDLLKKSLGENVPNLSEIKAAAELAPRLPSPVSSEWLTFMRKLSNMYASDTQTHQNVQGTITRVAREIYEAITLTPSS